MKKRLLISLLTLLCCSTGTWASSIPGALSGRFTINASGEKVVFSQGNLQYVGTWQFAEHQWDCFSISQYNDHRDLFGWGTGDAPNKVSGNSGDYGTFTDWGTNAITNGGNTENSGWRTLTKNEWVYLFYSRENAATLFGFGSVNSMNGLIILPDNWTTPEGASFTASTTLGLTNLGSYYHNDKNDNYTHNTYTAEQWAVMESAGAVFLPAAAYRHWVDSNIKYTDGGGFYWSSTPSSTDNAYYLNFYYNDLDPQFSEMRCGGRPVRLVRSSLQQDAEGYYLLGSAQDLRDFAALVNSRSVNINARLTADIDLEGSMSNQWTPIGNVTYKYNGVFDGQGHVVKNMYYKQQVVGVGFFGVGSSGAYIKNLRVEGYVDNSTDGNGSGYGEQHTCAGGIMGGSEESTLINCSFSGTVISYSNVGGIVGVNTSLIINCYNEGNIIFHSTSNQAGSGVHGAYDGFGHQQVINSYNVGSVINNGSSTFAIGSISDYGTISNCYSRVNCCQNGNGASWANEGNCGTTMSSNDMKSAAFVATLNANVTALKSTYPDICEWTLNSNGYPVHANRQITYTVPSSGIGTFSNAYNFTVPAGLTAYYCKTYDKKKGTISVVAINGPVPANTGVLLKGTPNETYTLTGTNNEAATVTDNALVAVTEATHVEPIDDDYTNFMLKSGTFITIANSEESVKMPANKAYLQILTSQIDPEPASARAIRLSWGGVTSIHNSQLIIHNYALPAKRIVKGKLIIEKNGQMFNANGQLIK